MKKLSIQYDLTRH